MKILNLFVNHSEKDSWPELHNRFQKYRQSSLYAFMAFEIFTINGTENTVNQQIMMGYKKSLVNLRIILGVDYGLHR